MTKLLATFYDLVMPELPKITTAMVDLQLVMVARDFCTRTRAWRADFEAIDAVAAQATYDLEAPESQAEVVMVHRLTISDEMLFDDLWSDDRDTDEPKYDRANPPFSVSDDRTQFTLSDCETPCAAATDAIVLRASMQPKQGATTLPGLLWSVHSEAMRAGVLARLMAMADKPWSAAAQAGLYASDFNARVQHAATNAQLGNTRRLLRTRKWG